MKLRISSCKLTPLKKDITRFAPMWALYFIGGLMVMLTTVNYSRPDSAARTVSQTMSYLSIVNLIYAGVCAQVLFGDLYNSRLCNALHALPMRREHWFFSHLAAGLCFSLVPHLAALPFIMGGLAEYWYFGLIWLLAITLQFLFFFGVAVFSALCVGNRLAMAAVYAILNFGALVAFWFCEVIYVPMMPGVTLSGDVFFLLTPVVQMVSNENMVLMEHIKDETRNIWVYRGFGEGWDYLAVCAVIGVALLGLALLIYRRRALESAGDFIAVKPLAPIFSVVFTLCAGAVCAMFGGLWDSMELFLIVGIPVGFFVSQMLLHRTVRVFKPKAFLRLGILAAALILSLLLVKWDAFGIVRWTPDAEDVVQVELSNRNFASTDAEDIETVIAIHKEAIAYKDGIPTANEAVYLRLCYTMKSGRTVERYYTVPSSSPAFGQIKQLLSRESVVMGVTGDWESWLDSVTSVQVCGTQNYITKELLKEDGRDLLEAIRKDCQAGTMAQIGAFQSAYISHYVELEVRDPEGGYWHRRITVPSNSVHTQQWLKNNKNLWYVAAELEEK